MIKSTSDINNVLLENFIDNFNANQSIANLYAGLSLISYTKDEFTNTFYEAENLVWDNMISLTKIKPGELFFACDKYSFDDYKDDFGKDKFYCINENITPRRLYKLNKIDDISINCINCPDHLNGLKKYEDGYEWEFLQEYTIDEFEKLSTKYHIGINIDIGKKINSTNLFISTDIKTEIPVKASIVSLVINPLDINMNPITTDFEWYAHRINFGSKTLGSFYLNSKDNLNGIIAFYDAKNLGYIISNKDFKNIKFSNITFTNINETYPIKKFIPSNVQRNSGYTIFMQKFKPVFIYKTLKFIISITEKDI